MFLPTIIEIAISVITAVVVLLLELVLVRKGKWQPNASLPAAPTGGQASSSVTVGGHMIGNQISQNTINQNIQISQNLQTTSGSTTTSSEASDTFVWGIGMFLFVVTAVGLGTIYVGWLLWFTVGLIISLAVTGIITGIQTRRRLKAWPSSGTHTLIRLSLAAASLVIVWPRILATVRDGISIESLRRSAAPFETTEFSLNSIAEHVVSQIMWVFEKSAMQGLLFLEIQLLSAVLLLVVFVFLVKDFRDWRTYLLFSGSTTRNKKAIERADRFEGIGWISTLVTVLILISAWFISGGGLYDLVAQGPF